MKKYSYDVVVVGAGPTGIAAAVEAARDGSNVALIERYGTIGGNLTIGLVAPIMGGVCDGSIAHEIGKAICPNDGVSPDVEHAKIVLTKMLSDNNIDVFLQQDIVKVNKDGDKITSVETLGKYNNIEVEGKYFIDCTGDGDLSALSDCDFDIGRELDGLTQPVSTMFTIEGIDPEQKLVCRHEEDTTVLSNGEEYIDLCRKAMRSGELPSNVNIVRLYSNGIPGERMVNAIQYNGFDFNDPKEFFNSEVQMRAEIAMIVDFLKNNVEGFENIQIKTSSWTSGVRESRRIKCKYTLTEEDLVNGRQFEDAVAHLCFFPIDIHNPSGAGQSKDAEHCPTKVKHYDIPFSAMTPITVKNLIVAGRCISGTHEAMASYRVMNICMAMGQAAGAATSLAVKDGITSHDDIDVSKVREFLIAKGVDLNQK